MAGPAPSRPMIPDATRSSGKDDGRAPAFVRVRPREPHERYDLAPNQKRRDQDYFWVSLECRGEPNPMLNEYFRAGWVPARAEDFPQHSGYDVQINPRLVALNRMKVVNADDPVIDRNLMLCVRPKHLSEESRREETAEADRQVNDHMRRLQASSRRAIGDRTQISRRVERSMAPPADMIPDEAELEE